MSAPKCVTVNGVYYGSLTSYAKHLCISPTTLLERRSQLGSYEAVEKYYADKRLAESSVQEYIVNGKRCRTRREVYDALNLSVTYASFASYVDNNGLQKAIEYYLRFGPLGYRGTFERYIVGDRSNLGIKDAAKLAHTAATTLKKRSEITGKSIQELLDESYNNWIKDPPPYQVNGKSCKNVTEVARALGVGRPAVKKRIDAGMTVSEAVKDIQMSMSGRKLAREQMKHATELGISIQLYKSILHGLKTSEAVDAYVRKYKRYFENYTHGSRWDVPLRYDCVINGVECCSPDEVCVALGISLPTLLELMRTYHKLSMQQRIDVYLSKKHRVYTKEHRANLMLSISDGNDLFCVRAATKSLVFARCAVCNRLILIERDFANGFKHSEMCIEYEWKE